MTLSGSAFQIFVERSLFLICHLPSISVSVNNNNNNNNNNGAPPWQSGRALTWDVTVATTLADSYVPASFVTAAAAAEAAASREEVKYSDLPASFSFQPIAVD